MAKRARATGLRLLQQATPTAWALSCPWLQLPRRPPDRRVRSASEFRAVHRHSRVWCAIRMRFCWTESRYRRIWRKPSAVRSGWRTTPIAWLYRRRLTGQEAIPKWSSASSSGLAMVAGSRSARRSTPGIRASPPKSDTIRCPGWPAKSFPDTSAGAASAAVWKCIRAGPGWNWITN